MIRARHHYALVEGWLWHPVRERLFCSIGKTMLSRNRCGRGLWRAGNDEIQRFFKSTMVVYAVAFAVFNTAPGPTETWFVR